MKDIRRIALTLAIGTTGTLLQSQATYLKFEGSVKALPLETQSDLENFFNHTTDLAPYLKNGKIPSLVDQYYQFADFLKTYNTAEFIHIHPTWVLVSNAIIEKRGIQQGLTYQTSLLDPTSPKFKVEKIEKFKDDTTNDNAVLAFSLVQISEGDSLGLPQEPNNLVDQTPILLFTGEATKIKILGEIFSGIDRIFSYLQEIKDGNLENQPKIAAFTAEIKSLMKFAKDYPGVSTVLTLLKNLKTELSKAEPVVEAIQNEIAQLMPSIRNKIVLFEIQKGLNKCPTFVASPYSHTKDNKLIFSHRYMPALCRLESGTELAKKFKNLADTLFDSNNAENLDFHMFHKSHSWFTQETKDTVPFNFETLAGDDTGQPIFAYNLAKNQYSLVSINQIPDDHLTTAPLLCHPSVLQWLINTTQDDYFVKTYPDIINLSGATSPIYEAASVPTVEPTPESEPAPEAESISAPTPATTPESSSELTSPDTTPTSPVAH